MELTLEDIIRKLTGPVRPCGDLYARTGMYPDSKDLHDAAFAAIAVLKKRLADRHPAPPASGVREMAKVAAERIFGLTQTAQGYTVDAPEMQAVIFHAFSGFSGAIPEGWKLVPIHPTEEMLFAGHKAVRSGYTNAVVWGEMLDAAPKHPDSNP